MKKVLFLITFLFLFQAYAQDFTSYCAATLPKKSAQGSLMSVLGINFVSKSVVENILEKEIKKETDAKFKIKIKNFAQTNFFKGEFKSLSATSKAYYYQGLYFSNLNFETICPYNKVVYENNELKFAQNLVLKYKAEINQDDLEKTLQGSSYARFLGKINKKTIGYLVKFIPALNQLRLSSFDIKIDKNAKGKFYLEKMEVLNDKIFLEGHILIYKNI